MAMLPALEREVCDLDKVVAGTARGVQPLAVAREAIGTRGHVLRAGDRRDPPSMAIEQMLDGRARPGPVVDVDVWAAGARAADRRRRTGCRGGGGYPAAGRIRGAR